MRNKVSASAKCFKYGDKEKPKNNPSVVPSDSVHFWCSANLLIYLHARVLISWKSMSERPFLEFCTEKD